MFLNNLQRKAWKEECGELNVRPNLKKINHTFSLQVKVMGMHLSTHVLQYSTRAALSLSHRAILHGMYQMQIVETKKNLFTEFIKTLPLPQN